MVRLRLVGAVVPVCLLLGCGAPQKTRSAVAASSPPSHPAAPTDLDTAKTQVLANLKDPDSARFDGLRSVHLTSGGKGSTLDVVCGAVNAKNSMGGYTGSRPFAYIVRVNDRAPTNDNLIDHFFRGRFILDDVGDDASPGWDRDDVEHLCGYETRFDADDDLLDTEMGKAQHLQEQRESEMWAAIRKREQAKEASSQAEPTTSAVTTTAASDPSSNDLGASQ